MKSHDWSTVEGARHWPGEAQGYGKNAYVSGLLNLIEQQHPQRVFEVGLGNGFPFVEGLLEKNIDVHGCDVSEFLLQELTQKYPAITYYHAGYETMQEKVGDEKYDVVYCLRSTWYFPDIFLALKNMLAITRPGGAIIFDIMNSDSPEIKKFMQGMRRKKYTQWAKYAVKKLLNKIARAHYVIDTGGLAAHYPVSPHQIDAFLDTQKVAYTTSSFKQITGERADFNPRDFRIIYRVQVPSV
ncbi:MAG: methyltransferase domain-containing protein [Candidatus Magasanikbacteria bacterium]|nr:methyltransferase domain-containing protein [Candidatus Magasanikbacteria bacterium]